MLARNTLFYNRLTLIGIIFLSLITSFANAVTLYTPYTKLSVTPGEAVNYSIDLINNSKVISNDEVKVVNLPKNWTYTLMAEAYSVSQVAVLNGSTKTLTLRIEIPFQVEKGNYTFYFMAGSQRLPLTITITERGSNESELSTTQPNMQGNSSAVFSYKAVLKNRTAEKQLYALVANVPRGWTPTFYVDGRSVTSVEMEPNTTKDINIDLKPSSQIEAKAYKMEIIARTGSTSAKIDLEAIITGSHDILLSTPNGIVSTTVRTGGDKKIPLIIRNAGSSDLDYIEMTTTKPLNWEVLFEPKMVDKLTPGSEATVYATIQSDSKSIPGDYIVNIEAKTPETSSKVAIRVTVKTPMIWGWVGIAIILAALLSVLRLFKKYGRR